MSGADERPAWLTERWETAAGAGPGGDGEAAIAARGLDFFYGDFHALKGIDLVVPVQRVTALIGPSGCGKSTLLRLCNRMSDTVAGTRVSGSLRVLGREIFDPAFPVEELRRHVGMVFQHPNPFPMSVRDNLAFGLRLAGRPDADAVAAAVERSLTAVGLWEALRDRLGQDALALSADFQQRLCLARALAVAPRILLMDEPCSSLDPIATARIEELIAQLKATYTIVIVTHSMQQAARISDVTGFLLLGELIEVGPTLQLFRSPRDPRTDDYISGRYG